MLISDEVLSYISYCPRTGFIRWIRNYSKMRAGDVAGYQDKDGYRRIRFKGVACAEHRLAWRIVYGRWPEMDVDHINGIRNDNRIENLRLASKTENQQNKEAWKTSRGKSSRFIGCSFHKKSQKWHASIRVNGRPIYLGGFFNEEDAAKAYRDAKIKYHPFNPIIRDGAE